jgi:hypothetical protein
VTDEQFDASLAEAVEELRVKQAALRLEYRLGEHERFVVDYEAGTLTFFEKERPTAEAKIVPLATHAPEKRSFFWAWANESYPPEVREAAAEAKHLYKLTGFDVFKEEYVDCDEEMAWEIAAMACKCLGKAGAYRVPHAKLHSYVLIGAVRWVLSE